MYEFGKAVKECKKKASMPEVVVRWDRLLQLIVVVQAAVWIECLDGHTLCVDLGRQ